MTATQNYGNIKISTPILSADPNVKEDVMTDAGAIFRIYKGVEVVCLGLCRIQLFADTLKLLSLSATSSCASV